MTEAEKQHDDWEPMKVKRDIERARLIEESTPGDNRMRKFDSYYKRLLGPPFNMGDTIDTFRVCIARFPPMGVEHLEDKAKELVKKDNYTRKRYWGAKSQKRKFDEERASKAGASWVESNDVQFRKQLKELSNRDVAFDFDRDWQWAMENLSTPDREPKDAPSATAWQLFQYGITQPAKFVEKTLIWSEKLRKETGETHKQWEDDRREKFRILERVEKNLKEDVTSLIDELLERYPESSKEALQEHGYVLVEQKEANGVASVFP